MCSLFSCRLGGLAFLVAFLAPVSFILFINFIAFVLILRSLLTTGTKVTGAKKTKGITQARRSIAISVVLGLTWIFGILAIRDAKLFFQYLFSICNSLQGLLVFIFYCVLSKDTRTKLKSLCSTKSDSTNGRHDNQASVSGFNQATPGKTSYNNTESLTCEGSLGNPAVSSRIEEASIEMQ